MVRADGVEIERKYDVDESAPLPPLGVLPGVESLAPPEPQSLDATYFDTEDLALAAQRITLRRRTGGDDAGWHLKLPLADGARKEVHEPLGRDAKQVPDALLDLVRVHVRDRPVVPIARLRNQRTVHRLVGPDNTVLADFADDRVKAEVLLPEPAESSWREWELELVSGPEDLLEAADTLLAASGRYPAALPSKLARALGSQFPAEPAQPTVPKRKGPAADVLLGYAADQLRALKTHDPGVRQDEPDAVHQLRVAARRLRSVLASSRKLVERETVEHLREELQWLAGAVGEARDTEVMRERLAQMVAEEPAELVMGPVAQAINENLGARYHAARLDGLEALGSQRYFDLVSKLEAFLSEPPLTDRAVAPAAAATAALVDADLKKLRSAVAAAEAASADARDAALHEVRKKAKRLRYSAEAAIVLHGKRAARLSKRAEAIQDILGALQDSVVTRQFLRELGAHGNRSGANGFTFGRLHAKEEQRAKDAEAAFAKAWNRFKAKPLPR